MLEFTIDRELDGTLHKGLVKDLVLKLFVPNMQDFWRQLFPEESARWVSLYSMLPSEINLGD